MRELVTAAALLVAAAGVLVGVAAWLATRSLPAALPVLLDLLLAAGLLRLGSHLDWRGIAAAAAVIALRQLVVRGVRLAHAGVPVPSEVARFRAPAPGK